MKVEEIAEAIANLPPDQLARFRRWFTAFEAGRTDHAQELDSAALSGAGLIAIHLGMHTATRIAVAALPRIRADFPCHR